MKRAHLSLLLIFAVMLGTPRAGSTQTTPAPVAPVVSYDTPAHVSLLDGAAVLEREGRAEELHAGLALLQGDRIKTAVGRVEILFPDGSALYLDEYTQVDFLSDSLARVLSGRVTVLLAGAADAQREVRYQVDTPGGVVRMRTPGEFRVALLDGASGRGREVVLEVVRGEADLSTDHGSVPVRAGERSVARDGYAPSFPLLFNSARLDAFDVWTEQRRDARLGTTSTQYLPPPIQAYGGTFDRYGSWQYDAPYGHVWHPNAPVGWRPYLNGYWHYSGPYGWTWVASDPWGWPTHHFGRWGLTRLGGWFWIPTNRWAPAWVSWGAAPGYVGWCPLGFDNRPLISFVNYNVVNYDVDPFLAWTVIPHRSFGRVRRIQTVIVDRTTFSRAGRSVLVEQPVPPAVAHAAARPLAPLRAPTRGDGVALGYAVPRSPAGGAVAPQPSAAPPQRPLSIMGPGAAERRARPDNERRSDWRAPDGRNENPNGTAPRANDTGPVNAGPRAVLRGPASPRSQDAFGHPPSSDAEQPQPWRYAAPSRGPQREADRPDGIARRPSTLREPQGRPEPSRGTTSSGRPERFGPPPAGSTEREAAPRGPARDLPRVHGARGRTRPPASP
ncbi:MAG: FecR domain-containing protein [Acidobacteria bacterium]|nr:FecR domain-containing protein [Acidobacteriota bacterium]